MLTRFVKIIVMIFFVRCFYYVIDLISKHFGINPVNDVISLISLIASIIISFVISEILVDKMIEKNNS